MAVLSPERKAAAPQRPGYFARTWPMALLEGIFASAIGVYLIFRPANTPVFLLEMLGLYWLVSGFFKTFAALGGDRLEWWTMRLAGGIDLIVLGAAAMLYPFYSRFVPPETMVSIAAVLAMSGGILILSWGVNRGGVIYGDGWVVMSGLLHLLIGFVLLFSVTLTVRMTDLLVGALALFSGLGQIFAAFRLKKNS